MLSCESLYSMFVTDTSNELRARPVPPVNRQRWTVQREKRRALQSFLEITADVTGTFFSFLGVGWDWVQLVRRPLTDLQNHPRMTDHDECGAVAGMWIGRRNRSTQRKRAPVPLCSPQIPHDLIRARTRATAMGSRRLTAWAMKRPKLKRLPTQHKC
jgi:hypothetical protein